MTKPAFPRLDALSLDDLMQFRKTLDGAIAKRISSEKAVLEARLHALAIIAHGDTSSPTVRRRRSAVASVTKKTLRGRKAPVKYRGPNGETWAGRGLAPRWLVALEKKGKKRDSFLV